MAGQTSLLNTITNEEFTDLTRHIFVDEMKRVEPVAEQLYIKENLESHTGDSRRYDEIDMDMFASAMDEGEDAAKGYAGVGLTLALLKFSLINGENLTAKAKATLSKQVKKIAVQLQRLSERTLFISEATVWSA